MVRVDAPLFFANAEYVADHLRRLEEQRGDGALTRVVLDASGVDNLDSTAAKTLAKITDGYRKRGVVFAIVNVKDEVRDVMDAAGVTSA